MPGSEAEQPQIRIVVKVSADMHPELYAALSEIENPRGRAERLRFLATSQLLGLSPHAGAGNAMDGTATPVVGRVSQAPTAIPDTLSTTEAESDDLAPSVESLQESFAASLSL